MANTDIATRALVIAFKSPLGGKTNAEIQALTGLTKSTINRIYARAIEAGFDPSVKPITIRDEWLRDKPRSGRPSKLGDELTQLVSEKLSTDRYGREKSAGEIADEVSKSGIISISESSIYRTLRANGYSKTKPTRKPGLTKQMKAARLQWCLNHQHWTLEDWKAVIWSDETSIVLNQRRGGYRIWRKPEEALLKSCIRERWKGYSEFMFWGCFTYDRKGPCHAWIPETAAQRKAADIAIQALNDELEPMKRQEWELDNGMGRMGLRNKPGRKPKWKWDEKHGKLTRSGGSGIDWWRYREEIILAKLIPFAKECQKDRPDTVVQEDKAPSHAHWYQDITYNLHEVSRLLWCGNSPDLNAIEPCWFYMKRKTTRKGAPKSRTEGIKTWIGSWQEVPQEVIQRWIERIPRHIQKIIQLEGGNEYKEGRADRKGKPSAAWSMDL